MSDREIEQRKKKGLGIFFLKKLETAALGRGKNDDFFFGLVEKWPCNGGWKFGGCVGGF